jgi:hypothetical protein
MPSKKPHKGSQQGWKHHFYRRDRAAREGRHLPTVGELLAGMSFLKDSLHEDAQTWAERIWLRLDEEKSGVVAADVFLALKRLTVGPTAEDFRFAYKAFSGSGHKPLPQNESAQRCLIYRVVSGDLEAIGALCGVASRRLRAEIKDSEEARTCTDLIMGLVTYAAPLNQDAKYESIDFSICRRDGAMLRDGYESKPSNPASPIQQAAKPANPKPPAEPEHNDHGIIVFTAIGNMPLVNSKFDGVLKMFKPFVGKAIKLQPVPKNLPEIRNTLRVEFPHAFTIIDTLLNDQASRKFLGMRPTILAGEPGCGKTTFAMRLAELLAVPATVYPCAGVHDARFIGSARAWMNAEPSLPASTIATTETANPLFVLDEIEKVGSGSHNGNLLAALLPLLEKKSASHYFDVFIEAEIDLSAVMYIGTANKPSLLPAPLRDRCRILTFPSPGPEHLYDLVPGLLRNLASEQNVDPRWMQPLTKAELDAMAKVWPGRSLRSLQRLLDGVLRAREQCAAFH